MSYDAIVRTQLASAMRRVEEMRRRVGDGEGSKLAAEAVEELLTALEELTVSGEELTAQTEELAAAQILLEEEHQRYADLFHFAPDPYLVTGTDGTLREANLAAAALLGLAERSWVGKPLAVYVAPGHLRPFRRMLNALAKRGRVDEWELSLVRRDGSPVDVSCTVAVTGGDPPLLRWAMRDVGRRRAAEEAARAATATLLDRAGEILASSLDPEATLQAVADLAAGSLAECCVVHLAREGRLHAAAAAHADPAPGRLLHRLARRFPLPAGGAHPAARVLTTRQPLLMEEVTATALEEAAAGPGARRLLEGMGIASAMVVPMTAGGRTLGTICFARTAEREPYGAHDLETAVELARRAALGVDNARLYEEARAATRAREEVLAVVSHDLRNPINAVLISAVVLEERLDPAAWSETDRRQLRAIRRAAEQMADLVGDLVDVQPGRALALERVEVGPLVRGAAEMFEGLAGAKGVALEVDVAGALPCARADRARVLQVLSNLLGNALHFTPEGGRVTLCAAPGTGEVRLCVTDTGPGIPPEHRRRIFEPYWQERPGTRGLGLGLAIARGIVEAHGGRIWVEAAPGGGSAFHFTLPASD